MKKTITLIYISFLLASFSCSNFGNQENTVDQLSPKRKLYGIKWKSIGFTDDYYYSSGEATAFIKLSYDKFLIENLKENLENANCKKRGRIPLSNEVIENRETMMPQIKEFFRKNFKINVTLNSDNYPLSKFVIPRSASNEQVNEIRKLINLKVFNIYEFDTSDSLIYRVKYNPLFFPKSFKDYDNNDKDYFHNLRVGGCFSNYENAVEAAGNGYLRFLDEWDYCAIREVELPGFDGSLEELSLTPNILEEVLQNLSCFTYDKINNKIVLRSTQESKFAKEFKILSELLKVKPFDIVSEKLEMPPPNQKYETKLMADKLLGFEIWKQNPLFVFNSVDRKKIHYALHYNSEKKGGPFNKKNLYMFPGSQTHSAIRFQEPIEEDDFILMMIDFFKLLGDIEVLGFYDGDKYNPKNPNLEGNRVCYYLPMKTRLALKKNPKLSISELNLVTETQENFTLNLDNYKIENSQDSTFFDEDKWYDLKYGRATFHSY